MKKKDKRGEVYQYAWLAKDDKWYVPMCLDSDAYREMYKQSLKYTNDKEELDGRTIEGINQKEATININWDVGSISSL